MLRALLAEFLGTFIFVSIILLVTTLYPNNNFVPLIIGLALAVSIYFAISASLASFNPGVSIALYARGDLTGSATVMYIIAEIMGAVFAYMWWRYMNGVKRCRTSP